MVNATLNCLEVMRALRVSRQTVRDMLAAGELRGFRRGKVFRVTRLSVEQLLDGVSTGVSTGVSDRATTSAA